MAILEVFGLEDTMHRLVGGDVNSLGNVLTLAKSLRNLLDDCVFWLEEIDDEVRFNFVQSRSQPDAIYYSPIRMRRSRTSSFWTGALRHRAQG